MGLRDQAQQFTDAKCAVLGISFDTPADNLAFAHKHGFPFQLLTDADRSVAEVYGAIRDADDPFANFPKRVSILIDPEGVVRKVYDVTDPAGHAGEVIADLAAFER